ncbi:MAG: hypothetical protein ACLR2G_07295 [Phascolarctobacterium faecium]
MQKAMKALAMDRKQCCSRTWRSDVIGVAAELIEVQPEYVLTGSLGERRRTLLWAVRSQKAIAILSVRPAGDLAAAILSNIMNAAVKKRHWQNCRVFGVVADLIGYDKTGADL